MDYCALKRTENLPSNRLVPQRKAFGFLFILPRPPFVMEKEKVPCGAPPTD